MKYKMFDLIVACDKNFGIGINGKMAWNCKEELKLFRKKTMDNILIMGRKTVDNLPKLNNREIWVLSRSFVRTANDVNNNNPIFVKNINEVISLSDDETERKCYVAGGAEIYSQFLKKGLISRIHLSLMNETYDCDTHLEIIPNEWVIEKEEKYNEFTHYELVPSKSGEYHYLNSLRDVFENGKERKGRNGITLSKFTKHLSFNLQKGFPLLTTKRMFSRGIIEELLFFLKGETDSNQLLKKNVKIWDENTNREFLDNNGFPERKQGIMGPMYGYQWRHFNAEYNEENGKPKEKGIDQLKNVIDDIRKNPMSRRHLLTDYNPLQVKNGVLYPCHSIIIQFYVDEGYLDMFCYIRSSDMFLGLPFNIASSSMMLVIISSIVGLEPRMVNITLGDAHVYKVHQNHVKEQLNRFRYSLPKLELKKRITKVEDIHNLEVKDFNIINYKSHSSIKAKMVA